MQERLLNVKELISGYNHQQVAELLGVHRETYRLKKTGARPFSQPEIKSLITIFKLKPSEVVEIFFNDDLAISHKEGEQ